MFASLAVAILIVGRAGPEISGQPTVVSPEILGFGSNQVVLWGIDAPVPGQVCSRDDVPFDCGEESFYVLKDLVGDRPVRCTPIDISGQRPIARCEVQWTQCVHTTCEQDWRDLSLEMVAAGAAIQRREEFAGRYDADEETARLGYAGVWAGPEWRGDGPRRPAVTP